MKPCCHELVCKERKIIKATTDEGQRNRSANKCDTKESKKKRKKNRRKNTKKTCNLMYACRRKLEGLFLIDDSTSFRNFKALL